MSNSVLKHILLSELENNCFRHCCHVRRGPEIALYMRAVCVEVLETPRSLFYMLIFKPWAFTFIPVSIELLCIPTSHPFLLSFILVCSDLSRTLILTVLSM